MVVYLFTKCEYKDKIRMYSNENTLVFLTVVGYINICIHKNPFYAPALPIYNIAKHPSRKEKVLNIHSFWRQK